MGIICQQCGTMYPQCGSWQLSDVCVKWNDGCNFIVYLFQKVRIMTHEEIYKQAVETYGVESQIKMAIEEMAELTNALMKLQRGRVTIPDVVEEIAESR